VSDWRLDSGRIVHPTSLTADDDAAFAHAVRLALAARATLVLTHYARRHAHTRWEDYPGVRDTLARWKVLPEGASSEDLADTGVTVAKYQLRGRSLVRVLLHHLEAHASDLVVMAAARSAGLARGLARPVDQVMGERAGIPALFVPPRGEGFVAAATGEVRLRRLLVPVAADPGPEPAIGAAAALACVLGAGAPEVLLVHVGKAESAPDVELPAVLASNQSRELLDGEVVAAIAATVARFRPDLVALTTRWRQGLVDRLRGSTAERLVACLGCPVMAVPARR